MRVQKNRRLKVSHHNVLAAAALAVTVGGGTVAMAQPTPTQITWTNPGNGNWTDTANWDLARTPAIATNDAALIGAGAGNGGTASISGAMAAEAAILDIGQQAGQTGKLEISGGTLTLLEMRIGGRDTGTPDTNAGGTGSVVQSGGDVSINFLGDTSTTSGVQSLYIGDSDFAAGATANGSYTISAGTLNVGVATDDSIVLGTGGGSVGAITQTGGDVKSTGFIILGRRGATGSYTMSGGTLDAQSDFLWVGDGDTLGTTSSIGSFTQTGGSVHVKTNLELGRRSGRGSYSVSTGTLDIDGSLIVGGGPAAETSATRMHGVGQMTLGPSSVTTVGVNANVGFTSASVAGGDTTGTLSISPGASILFEGNNSIFAVGNGIGATGVVNQTGGTVALTNTTTGGTTNLSVGRSTGVGNYNLTGGTITTEALLVGGDTGQQNAVGTMTQSGNTTVTVLGNMNLGIGAVTNTATGAANNSGNYQLQGGQLLLTASGAIMALGNGGTSGTLVTSQSYNRGTFTHTGGTVSMTGATALMDIGRNGGAGMYTLSGTGVLNANRVALSSAATPAGTPNASRIFGMSGGTATIGLLESPGTPANTTRQFQISGGTLNVTNLNVVNNSLMNITGGNVAVSGNMTLGGSATLSTSTSMAFNPAAMLWSASTITTNGNNVTFGGAITYNTGTPNITKNGTGTLTVTGTQNSANAAILTVAAGTLNLNTSPGTGLRVNANSTTNFNNGSHRVGTIVVGPSAIAKMPANGNRTMYVNKLTIDPTGALDMADNDLVVNAEAFTTVKNLVLSGFGSPSGGITSSTSDGSQILALFDNTILGSADWNGQTISTTATVGKYTYFGDVNFDGQVTGDDYTIVDSNLNTTPPVGFEWLSGDANLDGLVTGDDYTTIDSNLGLGSGNPLSASALSGAAAVPEPGSIGLIMSASVGLLMRRRRSVK